MYLDTQKYTSLFEFLVYVQDSRDLKYGCEKASAVALSGRRIVLPPGYWLVYQVTCPVANNAAGLTIHYFDGPTKTNIPLPIEGSPGQQDFFPYPSLLDMDILAVGDQGSIPGLADVTVQSAGFDPASSTWTVEVQITNQFGHDLYLTNQQHVRFTILSNYDLAGVDRVDAPAGPSVPPGFSANATFSALARGNTWTFLFVEIMGDGSNTGSIVFQLAP